MVRAGSTVLVGLVGLVGCGRFGFDLGGSAMDAGDGKPTGASTTHDEDGDGLNDGVDNCPAIPNADQSDGDDDGVGDPCDPSPAIAHRIVLFDGFDTLPAWEPIGAGTWTNEGDDMVERFADTNANAMIAPDQLAPPLDITIGYRMIEGDTASTNWTMSVVDAFDSPSRDSQKCGESAWQGGHVIGLEMNGSTVDVVSVAYADAFVAGADYITTMHHDDSTIDCTTSIPAMTSTIQLQRAPYRTSGKVGVRLRGVSIAYHYIFVVAPR